MPENVMESARHVNGIRPIRRDELYSRAEVNLAVGAKEDSDERWEKLKAAGLHPVELFSNKEMYDGGEIIDIAKKIRDERLAAENPPPKPRRSKK